MIYGRFRDSVVIKRRAVIDDVKRFEGRKPDQIDRDALANDSYVIVESYGKERLYHLAFLRADGGLREITEAIEAVSAKESP